MPALLIRMSTEPRRSAHASTTRLRDAGGRDVGLHELVAHALGLDQLAGGAVVVDDARHEHVRAALGEREREGLAEARVAAGDDGVLALEAEVVQREIGDRHPEWHCAASGHHTRETHRGGIRVIADARPSGVCKPGV